LCSIAAAVVAGATVPVLASPKPTNSAVVAPSGVVSHAGRWMVDEDGHVVIIHGVNMPTKELPAYPAALNFGNDDARLLAASGLNAVRLTVERYAVEPKAGQFDDAYLGHVEDTIKLLARHGILSLIDFHQDSWGPTFYDNGFPDWMTMTDGLPNLYQVGFPAQYFLNPALNRAFDHFWANDVGPSGRGLQDDDADILAHVAHRFAHQRGVLGYEIMNEPWPGTQYPTCTVPAVGCPVFDQGAFSAYYAKVITKIRAADPKHLIWYEPVTTFNQGVPTSVSPPTDPKLGFAFHDYPLCGSVSDGADQTGLPVPPTEACAANDSIVLGNAEAHATATRNALLQTEFGASTNIGRVTQQLDVSDQHTMPWMFWSYTRYIDPYAPDGTLLPATPQNINHPMLTALARPYPQLVSGTPTAWNFDAASKAFSLQYSTTRADGHGAFASDAETDIAVPATQYPDGYTATVTGGTITSETNAPVLRVQAGTENQVTVTITAAGDAGQPLTNSACPAEATSAAGVAGVDVAPSTSGPQRVTGCMGKTGVVDGTVNIYVDPSTGRAYVVQDGKSGNPNLLGGYLGVDSQHTLTLVGCAGGDYDANKSDEWNQSPDGPQNNAMASLGMGTFTAPSGPVGPTSPCSPPIVPARGTGDSCGTPRDPSPSTVAPGNGSPLNAYTSGSPNGSSGIAGDFGGNDGASGYLQVTSDGQHSGNIATGGTSKGGGGTVAVGNDGHEGKDSWTPEGSPIAICQD
jgi:endoglycosylceramidase